MAFWREDVIEAAIDVVAENFDVQEGFLDEVFERLVPPLKL